jgi:hypothetical protein
MSLADVALSDDEIFSRIATQDRKDLAVGSLHAAEFVAFAAMTARQAFSAMALASDDETLWCYAPDKFEFAEKPSRIPLTFAAVKDYESRGLLFEALVFNARSCRLCGRRAVKHTAPDGCEYSFGASKMGAA